MNSKAGRAERARIDAAAAGCVSNGALMARATRAEYRADRACEAATRSGTRLALRAAAGECGAAAALLRASGSHTRAERYAARVAELEEACELRDFRVGRAARHLRTAVGWLALVLVGLAVAAGIFGLVAR